MKIHDHDLYRYAGNTSVGSAVRYFLSHPGYRFTRLKRLCEKFGFVHPVGLAARLWYRRLKVKYGFQIPHTCRIDGGLFMGHYGNIVINQQVVIGRNCNIAQGVTIGQINRGSKTGSPVLGDQVWIGANAVIVGNITIGNNVLIAPLSYVNINIPDNAVVLGNPATVVNLEGSAGYINNVPSI